VSTIFGTALQASRESWASVRVGCGLTRNRVVDAVFDHLVHLLDGFVFVEAMQIDLPHGTVVFISTFIHGTGETGAPALVEGADHRQVISTG